VVSPMANSIDILIGGDMTEALERLSSASAERVLRASGYAGAEVFVDEAVKRVPVKTGTIKRNIIAKRIDEKSDGSTKQTYYVTVRSGNVGTEGDAFYWRWVENGHSLSRRKTKGKTWKAHRAAMKLEYGDSKTAARPFMRPAYEAKKEEAVDAMRAKMAELVQQLLKGK